MNIFFFISFFVYFFNLNLLSSRQFRIPLTHLPYELWPVSVIFLFVYNRFFVRSFNRAAFDFLFLNFSFTILNAITKHLLLSFVCVCVFFFYYFFRWANQNESINMCVCVCVNVYKAENYTHTLYLEKMPSAEKCIYTWIRDFCPSFFHRRAGFL